MKITSGPNLNFYIVTGFFLYASVRTNNWWILVGWFIFCALMIPLSLWAHEWNKKREVAHREFMLKNYGNDPWVQEKFGATSKRNGNV